MNLVFIVQLGKNGIPTTDLGYQLIQACEFQNWRANSKVYTVLGLRPNNHLEPLLSSENMRVSTGNGTVSIQVPAESTLRLTYGKYIPVGTIEFVEKHLGWKMKPINIPVQLSSKAFLKRDIFRGTAQQFIEKRSKEVSSNYWYFVKSDDAIKAIESDTYTMKDIVKLSKTHPTMQLLISELIQGKIESEWRVFVYKGKVVGLESYSGDIFSVPPSKATIQSMISKYTDAPKSYTLDVAVTNVQGSKGSQRHTVLVEVHNFVACGLYGFEEYQILPQMVTQGFLWELSRGEGKR